MLIRRAAIRHILVSTTALLALGCASRSGAVPEESVVSADQLALEIDNHNWSDVALWINHDGRRERFLTISAAHSLTRAIPPNLVGTDGTVQFVAHRIGGGNDYYVSPRISVRTGYTVSLTLEDNLQRSTIGIW